MVKEFLAQGWRRFAHDPALAEWVHAVRPYALKALDDPALSHWMQCEGTWFVGVDALANDATGAVAGSGPLRGLAVDAIAQLYGPVAPLHRAQLSTVFPGYPQPRAGESDAAFRYRRTRDGAHVDGLLAEGPERRRFLREPHAWILGLPLSEAAPGAAPLVVWDGSHRIMGDAFRAALAGQGEETDVTDAYQAARRQVFATCTRRTLPARPGEAILLHRHLLHGVAPWQDGASAPSEGRMIAYFRPELVGGLTDWLAET